MIDRLKRAQERNDQASATRHEMRTATRALVMEKVEQARERNVPTSHLLKTSIECTAGLLAKAGNRASTAAYLEDLARQIRAGQRLEF